MSNEIASNAENPLNGPYKFEGLPQPGELVKGFGHLLGDPKALALRSGSTIGVLRAGENAHGTWGETSVWNGTVWEFKGFTLEPRVSVGKGPIPLGDFSFVRWMSPSLGKTLRLSNVPGFTDILIHVGNTQGDTAGCILAAKQVDSTTVPTRLIDSRTLTDWFYDNHQQGTVLVRSA